MATKKITITLDEEDIKALNKVAEDDDRKVSQMVSKVVRDFLRSRKSPRPEQDQK